MNQELRKALANGNKPVINWYASQGRKEAQQYMSVNDDTESNRAFWQYKLDGGKGFSKESLSYQSV